MLHPSSQAVDIVQRKRIICHTKLFRSARTIRFYKRFKQSSHTIDHICSRNLRTILKSPLETPVVEISESILRQKPLKLTLQLALHLHIHELKLLMAIGKSKPHPPKQKVQLLHPILTPSLQLSGNVRRAHHGVKQTPLL
ncbi:hypothetical protein V8G54_020904 [Vigna mungo]|uniref:Uncharacterized protein n=1 Tax=Vigna mungo TaxID=3915 RepID=A0AAQ3NF56_VIGMU